MDQSPAQQPSGDRRLVRSRRTLLVLLIAGFAPFYLGGCTLGYLVKSAYYQTSLLTSRVPLDKALANPDLTDEQKRKLRLAIEAHEFAINELGLVRNRSYTSFVQLDRPYVTYVVSASARAELKPYQWWFPITGSVPYKGFFNPDDAKAEAEALKARGYDTYLRGVSAYSTLGWFNDPILSSMLNYKDRDLVETIIHETTHATIFIKGQADFNERLASFIGNIGAREFYRRKEGEASATNNEIEAALADERTFATFIAAEMRSLEIWYDERKDTVIPEDERQSRLREVRTRFLSEVRPLLKLADSYKNFEKVEINNALLLNFRLYIEKLDDFERVFKGFGRDFKKMLAFCKSLEAENDPKSALAKAASANSAM